jgi:hypothetical protein
MAKKNTKKVEKVIEEIKEEVPEALTFTEKIIARRGKSITVRTYSDGKVEEL